MVKNDLITEWVRTHDNAQLPKRAHEDPDTPGVWDTGYDLFAAEDCSFFEEKEEWVHRPSPCITYLPGGEESSRTIFREPYKDKVKKIHHHVLVNTGLQLANITPGWWFRIESKSGLGFKYHAVPHFGVIDNPYRGQLGVKIYLDPTMDVDKKPVFKVGEPCAQIIYYPLISSAQAWTDKISETDRGGAGFGSTHKEFA